jgi:anti-sigma factor RsiW
MNCKDARGRLWPPDQPRLARKDVLEARGHVDGCGDCTEYFEQDRRLLDAYERLGQDKAPLAVRERVFDALAEARWQGLRARPGGGTGGVKTTWMRRAGWTALLAAGVGAVALGVPAMGPHGDPVETTAQIGARAPADGAVFVEDYLRRAVGQDHIVTSDLDEVARFLTRELGVQFEPLSAVGLELERAEICLLEGRRGAMVVYKKDGAAVAHYIVPREGARPREPSLTSRSVPGGMPVVTWSSPAIEQALVGELGSEALLRIARTGTS